MQQAAYSQDQREQPAVFRNDRTRNPNTDLDRKAENENKENASKSEKKQKQESRGSSVVGACVSCGRETRALPTGFVCPKEIPSGVTLLAESQKHENRLRRSTSDQPQRSRPLLQVFVSTIVTRESRQFDATLLLPGKRYLNRLSSLDHMQSQQQSSSKQAENAAAALDFLRVQGVNTRTNVLPFPPSARAATGTDQRPRPRANAIFVFDDRCVSKQNRRQRLLLSMISRSDRRRQACSSASTSA